MAGYDISASFSESATQGFDSTTGAFNVGGARQTNWLVLGLVAIGLVGLWWFYRD
jgi:hypothetical protein